MYTNGLDMKHSSQLEDVADTFRALSADPTDEKSVVDKSALAQFMLDNYELEVCRSVRCKVSRYLRWPIERRRQVTRCRARRAGGARRDL